MFIFIFEREQSVNLLRGYALTFLLGKVTQRCYSHVTGNLHRVRARTWKFAHLKLFLSMCSRVEAASSLSMGPDHNALLAACLIIFANLNKGCCSYHSDNALFATTVFFLIFGDCCFLGN